MMCIARLIDRAATLQTGENQGRLREMADDIRSAITHLNMAEQPEKVHEALVELNGIWARANRLHEEVVGRPLFTPPPSPKAKVKK